MCTYTNYRIEKGLIQRAPCSNEGTIPLQIPDFESVDPGKRSRLSFDSTRKIGGACYKSLFGESLVIDSGQRMVPLDSVRSQADRWILSLVAIRQDHRYLPQSLVYVIYKTPALRGFRMPFTKFIIQKTQGVTDKEYARAKLKSPRDDSGGPTMGHTYVVLGLYKGKKLLADYSFGYRPEGVENPDAHAHRKLLNEERLRMDYTVSREKWDKALATVQGWKNAFVNRQESYDLMGKNCTAFTRAVFKAAG